MPLKLQNCMFIVMFFSSFFLYMYVNQIDSLPFANMCPWHALYYYMFTPTACVVLAKFEKLLCMNLMPTKNIPNSTHIRRSWKFNDLGSVNSPNGKICVRNNFSYVFEGNFDRLPNQTKIITFVHLWGSQKFDKRGSVKSSNANICIKKSFRYFFGELFTA